MQSARPRPPPGKPKAGVKATIEHSDESALPAAPDPVAKPSNVTFRIATSPPPRLATMTLTFTGWPGTTTPPCAARSW